MTIKVKKRNGRLEDLNLDKINRSVQRACDGLNNVSVSEIVLDANVQFYNRIPTEEIDKALIFSAKSKIENDPEYNLVSARLLLNTIYKEVFGEGADSDIFELQYKKSFISNIKKLVKDNRIDKVLLEKFDLKLLADNLKPERDLLLKYISVQTLYDRYFLHIDNIRKEVPQTFWMRVAMGLSINETNPNESAIKFYNTMSQLHYLPSTPTLFNSGTTHSQLSSCYLNTFDDSIDGIFDGLWQEARKSKYAGGLGASVTSFRATNSKIVGTNGTSSGLIPWLKLFNDMALAVNQSGKRKGSMAVYLEPWHLDFEDFLELKKNTGDERRRCHDLFTAAWIPDLFMKAVENDHKWYMFSPDETPELHEKFGEEFEEKYRYYCGMADSGLINYRVVNAKELWKKILRALSETGGPWITFKDESNKRYNNQHLGIVHSSNLCTEILLHTKASSYSDGKKEEIGETAVCNLGSINLKKMINNGKIDYDLLADTVKTAIRMLDNVIDINFYPTEEARKSNLAHRPIGLGSMGWTDVMAELGISYNSPEAAEFCDALQEEISYHAFNASYELAQEKGPYSTFEGSLISKGILPINTARSGSGHFDWNSMSEKLKSGIRNGLIMAIAPTASISYLAGCSQSIEPDYSVLYVYSTLSGSFTLVNENFVNDCKKAGIWCKELVEAVKQVNGRVSQLNLPDDIKSKYPTAFEIDQKNLVKCAAARQKWLDMGQSLNLYYDGDSLKELNDMYFSAWKEGLKTTYYLRSKRASNLEKSTASLTSNTKFINQEVREEPMAYSAKACSIDNPDCESCQ